uniref:TBC1 domain family member 2 n=1 Tax=Salmo trutta TaxID=8032 RepID=A0A673WMC9_SALTR
MEGEDPKGNPSTASSHSLPPQAEAVSPADEDDCITTRRNSEETATHTNSMGQPSQDHQSEGVPAKTAATDNNQSQSATTMDNQAQQQPTESLSNTKLCGYLLKQGGPLKSWKWRWFTYEEKKSQLFYYRTAQDVTSLGRIELCSATFGYPLHGEQGTFHIQTPERTFVLKADNQEAMMYWLQQLQLKRLQHREQLTGESTRHCTDHQRPEGQGELPTRPGTERREVNMVYDWFDRPTSILKFNVFLLISICARLDGLNSLFTSHPAPGSTLSSSSSPSPIQELVWLLHKALEAAQLEKRTCTEFLAAECEQERLELLRHRERQAADLQGRLEELKAEAEGLRASLAQRDAHVAELQENITLMMAKNHSKQEVILKLSEQVAACMADPRRTMSTTNGLEALTFHQLQEDTENLKDDIEAYKIQNKFLNSEIYQLTKLWRNSSEQEKSLMVKCAYLEARNCQIESRYLGVLRKLQESNALEPGQREAVRNLIEDALKGDLNDVLELNPVREHDEYGFKIIPDYEVEDMKLLAKIQALEIRSHNLLRQEAGVRPLLDRWAQYMGGRPADDLCPSPELKFLLRCGVPREYRPRVWRWVVRARTRSLRERHPDRYEQSLTSPHQASRQIQLDLHRTLTTNQRFSSPSSPTLQQLQRILLAFSWQNPTIGYCQGLNRLAAIVLLVLESEEDAFWCLVAVVETIMPQDYYTKTLIASQVDQRVLKDFMAEKMPRLTAHFEEHSVDVSLITFSWFLVVFVESLPSDILLRVWDAFLYEGTKVIFRYALALFKYKEEDILNIHDNVEIYQYLRFFTKTISDGRKLTNIAFSDMNPFPMKLLKNRRALHLERLQGELRELEAQQREFVTESAERKDKDLDTILVSEDDEDL